MNTPLPTVPAMNVGVGDSVDAHRHSMAAPTSASLGQGGSAEATNATMGSDVFASKKKKKERAEGECERCVSHFAHADEPASPQHLEPVTGGRLLPLRDGLGIQAVAERHGAPRALEAVNRGRGGA